MSTFRTPVGPQPASVYWRRRLVVALGLLAVIIIVILIIARPGSGTPAPTPGGSGSPSPSASSSAAADGDTVECDPKKVAITPITDAASYDPGVPVTLSFTLQSSMTEPCLLSAGSDVQVFTVTSGDEVIWTSTDCQTDAVAAEIILKPGVPKEGSSVTWDRTRSSPDTCDTAREQVVAGGASYHLAVAVGDAESATTKQFLLY